MITNDLGIIGIYTYPMLRVAPAPNSVFPRLYLQGVRAKAWIEHKPWRSGGTDWQLWIERNGTLTRAKCPLRIEIESLLRSWLLRECKLPLSTLSYTELRLIAEGKREEARRLHAYGLNLLMPRIETPPIPYAK
jgi:hypothetical protein